MNFFTNLLLSLGLIKPVQASPKSTATTAYKPLSQATIMQAEKTISSNTQLTRPQVEAMAKKVTSLYFPNVDWRMLTVMCAIESEFRPNAQRKEYNSRGEVRDISYGLMQVLISTAAWIYKDLGRRAYGTASVANLTKPETSIYFGAAYVNWLRRWNGVPRSVEWIVRAYNGGPGWVNSPTAVAMTANHWAKYRAKKAAFYG